MSSSALNLGILQAKIGSIQNQADTSAVYSAGVWSFKNSTAVTSVTITDAGNVGIGTTNPQNYGAGAATLTIDATTLPAIDLRVGGTRYGHIEATTSSLVLDTYSGVTPIIFKTNTNERMRIDASGNLRLGTASSLYAAGERLSVKAPDASTDAIATWMPTRSTGQHIFLNSGGGLAGYINWTGTTTTYISMSDYRLKEHIKPMSAALSKVAQLKPCAYKWKADGSDGEGFIAHELAEVCPLAVAGEKDAVNEDGSIKPQGIDPSKLVALLTAAIQELSAKNEALEARLAALESKP